MDPLVREAAHVWFGRNGPIALKAYDFDWAEVAEGDALSVQAPAEMPVGDGELFLFGNADFPTPGSGIRIVLTRKWASFWGGKPWISYRLTPGGLPWEEEPRSLAYVKTVALGFGEIRYRVSVDDCVSNWRAYVRARKENNWKKIFLCMGEWHGAVLSRGRLYFPKHDPNEVRFLADLGEAGCAEQLRLHRNTVRKKKDTAEMSMLRFALAWSGKLRVDIWPVSPARKSQLHNRQAYAIAGIIGTVLKRSGFDTNMLSMDMLHGGAFFRIRVSGFPEGLHEMESAPVRSLSWYRNVFLKGLSVVDGRLVLKVSGGWAYVLERQGLVRYRFRRYPLRRGKLRICRMSKRTPMARAVPQRDIRRRGKKVQAYAAGRTG